ncbi:pre-rRNA-processing protein ESF2-like [Euphorbia lathyris]|uniref:pre-rRNA-processing protein ESF2-like n=1 Tax=Euphorbia lathyris TaxID=212925 RepID=UPI0033134D46
MDATPAASSAGASSPAGLANLGSIARSSHAHNSKAASVSCVGSQMPSTSLSTSAGGSVLGMSKPSCRPWERGDLLRRLATFKPSNWFGKPKIASSLACAQRGWMNIDIDKIVCESCGACLSFVFSPSWTPAEVESAGEAFSKLLDDGHKASCLWRGSSCPESLQANVADDEQYVDREVFSAGVNVLAVNGNNDKKKQLLKEIVEEEPAPNKINPVQDKNKIKKKKARLLQEAAKADMRGICYLSRIPPHMDHVKLRHILSQYGEIQRIYLFSISYFLFSIILAPSAPTAQVHRKRVGNQDQEFSEGWVEFTNKSTGKRVANMLNGEQIGGRKRSQFYYDIWNIKYLSKFKWDNLTEEIAYKSAVREQKLALEISAAKRERDFYLTKVEKSRAYELPIIFVLV